MFLSLVIKAGPANVMFYSTSYIFLYIGSPAVTLDFVLADYLLHINPNTAALVVQNVQPHVKLK